MDFSKKDFNGPVLGNKGSFSNVGNVSFSNDGSSYVHMDNSLYGSDTGMHDFGGSMFGSANGKFGSVTNVGNTFFASDGTRYTKIGNTLHGSDGSFYSNVRSKSAAKRIAAMNLNKKKK